MVPAGNGSLVKLSNVTTVGAGMSPGQIERYAQERSMTIVSNLLPQKPLAEAYKEAFAAVAAQRLPPEYGILVTGRGKLLQEALANFVIAFVLSLCFIYIVLAAQFESFVHPLTIMVSMFLSIPFGILTLKLLDKTLNIYSIMGLFLLMGVVKKNAILQVDYTNVLRERGMPRDQAQMEADRARLRPILMTTLAIVAGMLPVALGRGDGSASRASLATVVVGGQLLCLVVTLLITPVIYSTFDDMRGLRAFASIRFPRWKRALAGRLAWGGSRFGAPRPPMESVPGGEKGPAARRRPRTGREAYSPYVERPVEGGNEADGPLSPPGEPGHEGALPRRLHRVASIERPRQCHRISLGAGQREEAGHRRSGASAAHGAMHVNPRAGAQVHQHALQEGPEGRGIRGDAEVGDGKPAKGEPGVTVRAREPGRELVLSEQRDYRGDARLAQPRRRGGEGRFRARAGEEPTGSGKRGMDDLDHAGDACAARAQPCFERCFEPITSALDRTSARKPFKLPRWVRWTTSWGMTTPSGPLTSIAAVASDSMVTENPRCAASRAVVSQHIWVMKPDTMTRPIPRSRSSASSRVPVKEPGRCFWITGSPSRGAASGCTASAGEPGAKISAPGLRLSWTMWKTGTRVARAHSSSARDARHRGRSARQHHLADGREVFLLGVDDEQRGPLDGAGGYRPAPATGPLISILADWLSARIHASHAWLRFCSSTCFASSSRSRSKARGSAGWRSSDFTT